MQLTSFYLENVEALVNINTTELLLFEWGQYLKHNNVEGVEGLNSGTKCWKQAEVCNTVIST